MACLVTEAYVLFRWQVLDKDPAYVGPVPAIFLLVAVQVVTLAVSFASIDRLPKGFDLTNDRSA